MVPSTNPFWRTGQASAVRKGYSRVRFCEWVGRLGSNSPGRLFPTLWRFGIERCCSGPL